MKRIISYVASVLAIITIICMSENAAYAIDTCDVLRMAQICTAAGGESFTHYLESTGSSFFACLF